MVYKAKIVKFLNVLNSAMGKNHLEIRYPYFKESINILKILLVESVIHNYEINSTTIKILLKSAIIKQNMKLEYLKKTQYLSYYEIQNLIYINPTVIFVVSTSFGLLSSQSLLKSKTGGVLLFKIQFVN